MRSRRDCASTSIGTTRTRTRRDTAFSPMVGSMPPELFGEDIAEVRTCDRMKNQLVVSLLPALHYSIVSTSSSTTATLRGPTRDLMMYARECEPSEADLRE
mmetsp:Transcript_4382/g.9887  ORF Transcript_4382/g.9887 Transcript_4382/m.9887 type:complete len:101 (+) Transcript_4382:289-591(+)